MALPTKRWVTRARLRQLVSRLPLFFISIAVFIIALMMMKEGAKPLAPLIRNQFSVDSPASALGFGWLSASLALSGSPVAATALAFLDAGVLSPMEAFAMIAGSRLGAAFIVLLVGFIYLLRGQQREVSLGAGLLSLLVTQVTYIPVLALGFFILSRGWLQHWQINADQAVNSPLDLFLDPAIASLQRFFPTWILFPVGFLLIVFSLRLFDRVLPDFHLKESSLGQVHHLLYRPLVTFLLGAAITSLTMSVSVSLSLLVPLSARGYIRRENIIPYIMGSNITTFDDTLIAAALLANPSAVTVVLVQMVSVGIVSILILSLGYRQYERLLERLVSLIGRRRRNLFIYIFLILFIPLGLLILG
jgi:solute carrier family 34 (sodium-dependent phosphate cotransporter)